MFLATIIEDKDELPRSKQLELIKRARRRGKQLTIGMQWNNRRHHNHNSNNKRLYNDSRYYRNLETIFEEPKQASSGGGGWPKLQFSLPKKYKFYSDASTGHGEYCAYCFGEFVHRKHFSKAPIYLITCGHIICGHCVSLNSRPIIRNLSPLTRKETPYVATADYSKMACPACNVEFTWQEIYHFYL